MAERPDRILPDEGVSMKQTVFEDEVLETVWEMRERGVEASREAILAEVENEDRLQRMIERGDLLMLDKGAFVMSRGGEERARDITRRHRLAERLFYDVLDIECFEHDACLIEHAISPGVEEAICTMLGHPPTCPHGKPIPPGDCCSKYTRNVKPLVVSLRDMEVGKTAAVQFVTVPSMHRLASMGLVPGVFLRLQQKRPSFVIDVDETTMAIDEEIAKGIYVKYARQ